MSTQRCVTCGQVSSLTAEFKAIFTSPYNTAPVAGDVPLTVEQMDYNTLYARFLNYHTGLQMSWLEYGEAVAAVGCDVMSGSGSRGSFPANLMISSREVGRPLYQASTTIDFVTGFESETGAEFVAENATGSGGGSGAIACRSNKPLGDTEGYFVPEAPCGRVYDMAVASAQQLYQGRLDYLEALFETEYKEQMPGRAVHRGVQGKLHDHRVPLYFVLL